MERTNGEDLNSAWIEDYIFLILLGRFKSYHLHEDDEPMMNFFYFILC